jgi:hypothetical protein
LQVERADITFTDVSFRMMEAPTADLTVERADITFANVSMERVRIEVAVWNHSLSRSVATDAVLMAAPLGAFVPWRPLATLPVPAIESGESVVLQTVVPRPLPAPLGPPDRVPPRRLITALGAGDDRPASATDVPLARGRVGAFPADLMDLVGLANFHWAGNLNVFIGSKAVERHMAQALRIYPGRVNMAMFVVGCGRDAYRFHVIGECEDWDVRLFDGTDGRSCTLDVSRVPPVVEGEWLEAPGQRLMMMALCPPQTCSRGTVEVHVAQRSSGKTAVVEFSLDPKAAGPGCYVV